MKFKIIESKVEKHMTGNMYLTVESQCKYRIKIQTKYKIATPKEHIIKDLNEQYKKRLANQKSEQNSYGLNVGDIIG